MAKLLITTQVFENYAWMEDGSLGRSEEHTSELQSH